MKVRSIYIISIEYIKTFTNFILYPLVNMFINIFGLKNYQVFKDSNGWFFTIRYKENIFKFRWAFTFLRSGFDYSVLKNNIKKLQSSKHYGEITPRLYINNYYIKQEYINNSTDFDSYVANIASSRSKIDFFIKVIDLIDKLHECDLSHGDLKPKNILVGSDGEPFLVDLEFLNNKLSYDQEDDFIKLFNRALPWLSVGEVDELIGRIGKHHVVSKIISKKCEDVDCFEILLRKDHNIIFEKDKYCLNEDIDITVEDHSGLQRIIKNLKSNNITFQIHYCFCDDIKIYLYSGTGIRVLDVHLNKPIPVSLLMIKKILYNKVKNIYITGPDGVGKSTLIDDFFLSNTNNLVGLFNLNKMHANRFVKTNKKIDNNRFWGYLTHRFFGGIFAKKICIFYFKLMNKSKCNLFDRSLADSIHQYGKNNFFYRFVIGIFIRKDIVVLLEDNPENILKRKDEMTEKDILDYYNYFDLMNCASFNIQVTNVCESKYKLNSTINYLLLDVYR